MWGRRLGGEARRPLMRNRVLGGASGIWGFRAT